MVAAATRDALLDLAQEFAQTRGYNAFSFRDLAKGIGITSASIHYHFPTKGDLGVALMARYRMRFQDRLAAIDKRSRNEIEKLSRFVGLFQEALQTGNRICLCGMLATEYMTLPEPVQREVRRFFKEAEAWLASILGEGRKAGTLSFDASPASVARTFVSSLEGAMIAARSFGNPGRLASAGRWLVQALRRGSQCLFV